MKLILNSDVTKLGRKGDIVDVAKGYARNYLLPKNLAIVATDSNISIAQKIQEKRKLKLLTIGSKGNTFKILSHKIFENYQLLKTKYKNKIYKLKINNTVSDNINIFFVLLILKKIIIGKVNNVTITKLYAYNPILFKICKIFSF